MDLSHYAIDGVTPSCLMRPTTTADVASAISGANEDHEAVVLWGGGTRIAIGGPPARYDIALDLSGVRGVVEHSPADLVCTVRGGTTLAELSDTLVRSGQRWPVEVPDPEHATVGGTIASAAPSPARLRFQHPRDWIIGCEAVLGDGTRTRAGGRVVKNVTGYDLTRLYSGSYGTLAALTEVSLKLVAIDEARSTLRVDAADADLALRLRRELPFDAIVLTPSALYLRIAGAGAAVRRVVAAVGAAHEVADGELDGVLAQTVGGALVARCAVPPGAEARLVPDADIAFVGTGVAYVCRDRSTEALRMLRRRCEQAGGALVLERAPRAVRDALGTWGTSRVPAAIAMRLKERFDPRGVLAPGRMPA